MTEKEMCYEIGGSKVLKITEVEAGYIIQTTSHIYISGLTKDILKVAKLDA